MPRFLVLSFTPGVTMAGPTRLNRSDSLPERTLGEMNLNRAWHISLSDVWPVGSRRRVARHDVDERFAKESMLLQ